MLAQLMQVNTLGQVVADSTAVKTIQQTSKVMHLWDIVQSGGTLMIPLGLLLAMAIFFFFERYIAIRKAGKIDDNFMRIVRDHIVNGNIAAARAMSKNTDNPVARIIDKGIQRLGKPIDAIERKKEFT